MTGQNNTPSMAQINVELEDRSYPIFIGSGQIAAVGISRYIQGNSTIVTNTTVAKLYLSSLKNSLVISRLIL